MKLLLALTSLFLVSCNVVQVINDGETEVNFKSLNRNLEDGIYGFWRFEEAASTNRMDDFTGIVLTDTGGVASVSGISGMAADCSTGSSGSGLLESSSSFYKAADESYSLSFWVKLQSNPSGGLQETITEFTDLNIGLHDSDFQGDSPDLVLGLGGSPYIWNDVTDFSTPQWTHFALIIHSGGENVDLFINGSHRGSVAGSGYSINSNVHSVCSDMGGTRPLNGAIDSLGIWNRLLNPDEVWDLYSGNNLLD